MNSPSSYTSQRTNAQGGDDSRAGANASDTSIPAPSPAEVTFEQHTHVRCGWCQALVSGDPETVTRVGCVVNTGICPSCQSNAIEYREHAELAARIPEKAAAVMENLDTIQAHLEREQAALEKSAAASFGATLQQLAQ